MGKLTKFIVILNVIHAIFCGIIAIWLTGMNRRAVVYTREEVYPQELSKAIGNCGARDKEQIASQIDMLVNVAMEHGNFMYKSVLVFRNIAIWVFLILLANTYGIISNYYVVKRTGNIS